MRKKLILLPAVLLVVFGVVLRAQKPLPGPDPLVVAPGTHKLLLENKFVRVLEVHLRPGSHEPLHGHPHGVTVYLTDFDVRTQEKGKGPVTSKRKAGTAVWSEAMVHEVHNIGPTEGHVFRIELKF